MTLITEPGCYDLDSETYHADPCPTPSLSAGMINDLLKAPLKCWFNSKRLNPDWQENEKADRFTIGTVAHIVFLEQHLFEKKVLVLDFPDYRSKDALRAKADAKRLGLTPILSKYMDKINIARQTFFANQFASRAFEDGKFEQSLFWRHKVHGFWCRARPDFMANSHFHLCDYKTTTDADPEKFGKLAHQLGYHRRAAWYLEGYEAVFGGRPEHYWFISQEMTEPNLTAVVELKMQAIEAGQMENYRAAEVFAQCMESGEWYGYRHPRDTTRDLAFQADLPPWAYMSIDGRM
jgi:hypothetical protein